VASLHIADAETGKRARDAIRDILYLYRELVAYGGIVGDHDIRTFDPWAFVQATRSLAAPASGSVTRARRS
jgi:hypothetical protein